MRRHFPVKAYLDEILLSLRPQFKRMPHQIIVQADAALELDTYPGAFAQIVTNLVMNSLTHAFAPDETGQITLTLTSEGDQVLFIYSDNGCGIPAAHLDKIFEPFFTTKRGQGGSGLGLHIIYNLVTQKLGGSMHCESTEGEGTRFVLRMKALMQKYHRLLTRRVRCHARLRVPAHLPYQPAACYPDDRDIVASRSGGRCTGSPRTRFRSAGSVW